ncbi:integrase core domain-containing protein [Glutamicibacter creatinolyticus]|uniref:integrase core domain-containing protein n=1 Tax=Glutamicibacter creatinolyticus TaxID=162496 RepID=UPI0037BEF0C1
MSNALPPRVRAMIINYDPTQPDALSISEFCKVQKISRSIFYRIRSRAGDESAAALHPRSRAPKHPARQYGSEVINELVRILQQLKKDGWDYGPRTIYYEATIQQNFPGGKVPSVATIARLLASVGHVDRSPRKRPKSSYIPFARSTAMALWQLDAFEFRTGNDRVCTVYQVLDDATRYDVGSWAFQEAENSRHAQEVLAQAITAHGAPQELLSDNSSAFNQLRQGTIGAVEIFLASKGTMPISGLPGRPTTQGKNERSHQTLQRFLAANKPHDLGELRARIKHYRHHYNQRRPHQSLNQSTPQLAWELLEHTPASDPIPLAELEAKAAEYRRVRKLRQMAEGHSGITVSKSGKILDPDFHEPHGTGLAANQLLVHVTKDNRQVYYQGYHLSLPTPFSGRQFCRTITEREFMLSDPDTGEVVMSFPLPMVALHVRGRYVASYSIKGVVLSNSTKLWERKAAAFRAQFQEQEKQMPAVFDHG